MSLVTEHLDERGVPFEVIPHRRAFTSIQEARELGSLLGMLLVVDPEVLEHERVLFAAGTETESVQVPTAELFRDEPLAILPSTRRDGRASQDPIGSVP